VPLIRHLMRNRSTRYRAIATTGLLALAGAVWSPLLSARAEAAKQAARATEERARVLFADGVGPTAAPRALYVAARSDEVATHRVCTRRRFFALTRVDEPLLLQDADFQSLVFYAGRDQELVRPYAPLGACDYVITTPAVAETDKGSALVATLFANAPAREVSRAESLVLLARR
jgi:hypothetical protein